MNKIKLIIFTAFCFFSLSMQSQAGDQRTVTLQVLDENGDVIDGAEVSTEKISQVKGDSSGVYSFNIDKKGKEIILIKAKGFKSYASDADTLPSVVSLKKLPYQLTEEDKINVPFGKLHKRRITGAVTQINPRDILEYDDRINGFNLLNGRVPGLNGFNAIRGLGNAALVIDGIPRQNYGAIRAEEIESITVVRDGLTKMLYGSLSDRGVIIINTKRGESFKPETSVRFQTGVLQPLELPNFLNSADYMETYNKALANDLRYGVITQQIYDNRLYSQETIENTRNGSDPLRYPDVDYYSDEFLKPAKMYYSIFVENSGGNDKATYYSNIGWRSNEGLVKLGEGANERRNELSVRGNVDYKVNKVLSARLDGLLKLDIDNGPMYRNFNGDPQERFFYNIAGAYLPNEFPLLIPLDSVSDPLIIASDQSIDGKYVLGGTDEFSTNVYGDLNYGGTFQNFITIAQFNSGINLDFDQWVKGLTFTSLLTVDLSAVTNNFFESEYAVFEPSFENGALELTQIGQPREESVVRVRSASNFAKFGVMGALDYDRDYGDHKVKMTLNTYYDEIRQTGQYYNFRHFHYGLRTNYAFKNKYILEATGVVAGSPRFGRENRFSFSPGVGLGWIITEDIDLPELISYAKLRANYAIIRSDETVGEYFLFETAYSGGGTYNYGYNSGSNRGQIINPLGNPSLLWPQRKEMNLGFDVLLAENIFVEASYFNSLNDRRITQRQAYYPNLLGGLVKNENYDAILFEGTDFSVTYANSVGELQYEIGLNGMAIWEERTVFEELDFDEGEEYRQREGYENDAMFGFQFDRFYTDDDFNVVGNTWTLKPELPQSAVPVYPGDLKFIDRNNDGTIDDSDIGRIADNNSDLIFGFDLKLKYNQFSFYALMRAQFGGYNFRNNNYYRMQGNIKYSEAALDAWDYNNPNANAVQPALTSESSTNNFRNSDFWLYKDNWFSLDAVQISYDLDLKKLNWLAGSEIYVSGNNLLLIAKNRADKQRALGAEPQYRGIFTLGLNLSF